jgi:hypothetical protein
LLTIFSPKVHVGLCISFLDLCTHRNIELTPKLSFKYQKLNLKKNWIGLGTFWKLGPGSGMKWFGIQNTDTDGIILKQFHFAFSLIMPQESVLQYSNATARYQLMPGRCCASVCNVSRYVILPLTDVLYSWFPPPSHGTIKTQQGRCAGPFIGGVLKNSIGEERRTSYFMSSSHILM